MRVSSRTCTSNSCAIRPVVGAGLGVSYFATLAAVPQGEIAQGPIKDQLGRTRVAPGRSRAGNRDAAPADEVKCEAGLLFRA